MHVDVGGFPYHILVVNGPPSYGLMADPGTAALDPIFYLHHSNIDRMWAEWNAYGNSNPTAKNWLDGPAASGERGFVMPMPDRSPWVYTPADVNSLSQLDYAYEDLPVAVPVQPAAAVLTRRLNLLRAAPAAIAEGGGMDSQVDSELLGAHDGALPIKSSGARATVRLDTDVRRKVSASLAAASETALPDHVYLHLENVRGTRDAHKLSVYVNEHVAGTVALFGLRRASSKDGQHGGEGLDFVLNITNIIDTLHLDDALDVDSLNVRIVPSHAVPDNEDFSVGRVSVYRQGYR